MPFTEWIICRIGTSVEKFQPSKFTYYTKGRDCRVIRCNIVKCRTKDIHQLIAKYEKLRALKRQWSGVNLYNSFFKCYRHLTCFTHHNSIKPNKYINILASCYFETISFDFSNNRNRKLSIYNRLMFKLYLIIRFYLFSGASWATAKLFYIVQEQAIIVECTTFLDAIDSLIAVCYMLDREYTKTSDSVLEFIQRYVFKINPVVGSKGKTVHKRRIFTLIEKIYQHQQHFNEKK